MLLYILFASSEVNTSTHAVALLAIAREHETLTFSLGGIPLTLSKEMIKHYPYSNFNKLLNQIEDGATIEHDAEGRIVVFIAEALSPDSDLSQLVFYIKEFIETGTLQEFKNPTETIVHNYRDLYTLAQRLLITSLQEALERFLESRSVFVYCNLSQFDSVINKLESKKDNTLSVIIDWNTVNLEKEKKIILFQKLAQMPYLVSLTLRKLSAHSWGDTSNGDVKSEGARILADLFRNSPTLTDLAIIDGAIGDEGAIALANMLETNKHLKLLNLRRNNITDLGVVFLLDALKTNTTLKEINLKNNSFSKVGIEKLVEVLRINKSIQKVTLSPEIEDELQKAVETEFQQRVDFNFSFP